MNIHSKPNKVAVFIDSDNVSSKNFSPIIEQAKQMGTIVCKRAFGNWAKPNLKNCLTICTENAITPVQVTEYVSGKNGTDIRMMIDIMEVSYTKDIDIFIVVSSDSDFSPLVINLVERGKYTIGYGEPKTPQPLINAYSEFRFLVAETNLVAPSATVAPAPKPSSNYKYPSPQKDETLNSLIKQLIKDNQGAVKLSILGTELRQHPTVDIGKFGYSKVSELVEDLPEFEIFMDDKTQKVRLKNTKSQVVVESNVLDETTLTNLISQAINSIPLKDKQDGWTGINRISQYLQHNHGLANMSYQSLTNLIGKLSAFNTKDKDGSLFVKDVRIDETEAVKTTVKAVADLPPKVDGDTLRANQDLIDAILLSIDKMQDNNGLASMIKVGAALGERGFSAKKFGYKTLVELLKAIDLFDLRVIDGINHVKAPLPKKVDKNLTHDETVIEEKLDESIINNNKTIIEEKLDENILNNNETVIEEKLDESVIDNDETIIEEIDDITQALVEVLSETVDDDEMTVSDCVIEAIQAHQDDDGWAKVGDIGNYLREQFGIKTSDFGSEYRNIGQVIETLPEFITKKEGRFVFVKVIESTE